MLTKYVQNASKSVHSVYTGEESNQSKDFLKCQNIELMSHPPEVVIWHPMTFFIPVHEK